MAAPASVDDLLDLIRRSGVADEKRLDSYLQRLSTNQSLPNEPNKLAGMLVRDGLLTHFQAEQLLQGKWRRFNIGKYKVLERLGSGGMGSVYLCEHKLMRRRVAVKVLPAAKATDPSSLERFYREARAVAALDHPNLVHAYDIDQDDSLHFLVMEYVDGSNLQDIIKRSGPMNVLRACHYIRQTALGLEHAHESGLVHRDIKPGNILVDRTGGVKILDMGLARFFNDEEDILTKKYDENVLGTADYLAPEQALDSHGVDIRADIYSLGATFYFLLTGRTPFGEGTVAQKLLWHQTRMPKPVTEYRKDVPAEISAIALKMMAKEPSHRFQIPGEVATALEPFTRQPIGPPPISEMPSLSPAATGIMPSDPTPDTAVVKTEQGTPTAKPANSPQSMAAPSKASPPTPSPNTQASGAPSPSVPGKPSSNPTSLTGSPRGGPGSVKPQTPRPGPSPIPAPPSLPPANRPRVGESSVYGNIPMMPSLPAETSPENTAPPTPPPSKTAHSEKWPGNRSGNPQGAARPMVTVPSARAPEPVEQLDEPVVFQPADQDPSDPAPWEAMAAADTEDPSVRTDTTPGLESESQKRPAALGQSSRKKNTRSLLWLTIGLGVFLFASVVTYAILNLQNPRPNPLSLTSRPKLEVTRDPARLRQKNVFNSIQAALKKAKRGDVIEIQDAEYQENVVLDPSRTESTEITIQAGEGKTVRWRSASRSPETEILKLSKAAGFNLKGKGITFDGTLEDGKRAKTLVMVTLAMPGMKLEDAEFKEFGDQAILVFNASGLEGNLLAFNNLRMIAGENAKPRGAIFFDANNQVLPPYNDFLEVQGLQIEGIPAALGLVRKDKEVMGANVKTNIPLEDAK